MPKSFYKDHNPFIYGKHKDKTIKGWLCDGQKPECVVMYLNNNDGHDEVTINLKSLLNSLKTNGFLKR